MHFLISLIFVMFVPALVGAEAPTEPKLETSRPIEGIRDNAFIVEEAYNQPAGVVQHILTGRLSADDQGADRERDWELVFTQEWPIFSQRHQFSYAVPYLYQDFFEGGESVDKIQGVGDVALSYRFQPFDDEEGTAAFAPRFTILLPTGDDERGLGNGVVGYQWNLPVSKTITDRVAVHFNAGFTFIPNTHTMQASGFFSNEFDLYHFNVGGSMMYAATDTFHFVFETLWSGSHELEEVENLNGDPLGFSHRFYQHDVTFLPGVRMAFNLPHDLQIVPGFGVPIGLTENAADIGVFFYLSIEHPFMRTSG